MKQNEITTHQNDPSLAAGALFSMLSAVGFGTLLIFGKLSFEAGLGLSSSLAWRFLGAAAILWAILLVRRCELASPRRAMQALGLGAVGYAGSSVLFFASLRYISISLTSLLLYLYPSMVTLLFWLRTRQRPSGRQFVALGLSLLGCALILHASWDSANATGIFFGLGAALVYAAYLTFGNALVRTMPPLLTSAYLCSGAALSFCLASLVQGTFQIPLDRQGCLVVLGLVAVATVLPLLCLLEGVKRIGASHASIFSTIEPLVSVAFGFFLFGETLTATQGLGAAFVMAAVLVLGIREKRMR